MVKPSFKTFYVPYSSPFEKSALVVLGLTEYSDFRIEWDAPASESHLRTLSGTEEGLFVWIAANYIMDNLKSPESETTGT